MSVIPRDKTFNAALFLRLVHSDITFDDLQVGFNNLQAKVTQQSNQRVNLVRSHYGLFIKCAEGLNWLKSYRKESKCFQNESVLVTQLVDLL